MAIDLARIRTDTPGCTNVLHLNNAGAEVEVVPSDETGQIDVHCTCPVSMTTF